MSNPIEDKIIITSDISKVLAKKKFEHLQRIQTATRTYLNLEKNDVIVAKGGIKAIQKAREMIGSLIKSIIK